MDKKLEQSDLDRLIRDEVEENASIEYKRAKALDKGKKIKIAKTVSAMANAAGGIIIYGIAEYDDETKKHLPEKIDPIDRTEFTREWLEQVIDSNICPRMECLEIYPVPLDTGENDVVYVVNVPQSMTAHQVTTHHDHRYYERLNFQVMSMPDYRIRDVMNRGVVPNAEVKFFNQRLQDDLLFLKIEISNLGKQVIRFMKLKIIFPNLNNCPVMEGSTDQTSGIVTINDTQIDCKIIEEKYQYQINYSSSANVLFPEETRDITKIVNLRYRIDEAPKLNRQTVKWVLYADAMLPKHGEISIFSLNENAI